MAGSKPWWFNRIGQVAEATVTSVHPEPQYGAALDLSTGNMSDTQFSDLVNDVQTVYQDEEAVEKHGWFSAVTGGLGAAMDWTGGKVGTGVDWLKDRRDDVREAVLPEGYHEWLEDFEASGNEGLGAGLQWVDEEIIQPWDRALSTVQGGLNVAAERREGFFDFALFDGETWSEAWKRSEYTTLGQNVAESNYSADKRKELHRAGFNFETGQPNNAAYADIRVNDPWYNIGSGGIDFARVWFADPTVIAGKGVGVGRALVKADLDRMPKPIRSRFEAVVTASADDLAKIKATNAAKVDPITRRAITVRESINGLADRVRKEELSVPELADMQAFATAANGPVAANAFAQAARMKKFDPETGWTDEFDTDLFDTTVAALVGHSGAMTRLAARRDEVGDSIKALYDNKVPGLDEAIRNSEARLGALRGDPTLVGQEWRLADATFDLEQATVGRELFEQELRKYDGYADWMTSAIKDVDLRMAPREGYSIGQRMKSNSSSVYRGSSHAPYAQTVTKIPRAMFLQRPGVTDLHRPGDAFESGRRYFDETLKIAEEAAEASARDRGFGNWAELRETMLTRLAAASTDVERRDLMSEVETIGFQAVANRHGLSRAQASEIVEDARALQRDLVSQVKRQAQERAYSPATNAKGERLDTFTYKDGDGRMHTIRLPIDVTQLENYYIAADLTVLNRMLRAHGDTIKAQFASRGEAAREIGVSVLSTFNHYWKPATLFRLGYPMRTMTDETLRTIGMTGSLSTMVGQTQAFAKGVQNIPRRLTNRTRRAFNRHILAEQREKYPLMNEITGPEMIPEVLGAIDAPNPARLAALTKLGDGVEKWIKQDLHAAANGVDLRVKPPAYLERMNARLEEFDNAGDGFVALNPGNVRPTKQGNIVMPYESTRIRAATVDSKTLVRFINEHADILSNPNAVVTLRKADGMTDVEIGFKVPKKASKNPVRGVRFIDNKGKDVHDTPELGAEVPLKPQTGEGSLWINGNLFEDGFGQHGGMMRVANSSSPQQASLHKSYEHHVGALRRATGATRTYLPKDQEFVGEWGRLVNQMKTSPIIQRVLDNWEDEDIVSWLRSSREGQQHVKRMPHKAEDPEQWVAELRIHADELLTTDRLRQMAKEGKDITAGDLETMMVTPGTPVPKSVDGLAYDLASGQGPVSRTIDKVIETGYNTLATLPTDTLVRNPFFLTNYRHRVQQIMDMAPENVHLTQEVKQAIESRAREHALNQTRKYLFSLADGTEFTHALRFMSPFVGAWQETMVRWFRIFTERPESFARMYVNGWEDMGDLWGVTSVDENGQVDPNGENIQVAFPGPVKALAAAFPGISKEDLENMTDVTIPKSSLNVSLQGSPFWLPSPGPMVQLPATWMLENSPHLANENAFSEFAWSWMFPIGMPDSNVQAVMPAWVNQLYRQMQGIDDPVFANLAMGIYKDEVYQWRGDGQVGPEPTFETALEKAQGVQFLYVAGRLAAPFSFQVQPESQLFIDKAREYREQYGWEEGLTKFTQEVGDDAYMWWTSMSKTNLNIAPTSSGFKGYQAWQPQINKNPDLAALYVGLDAAEDQFNYAVYDRQRALPVSPTDPRPQRGNKTPEEALAEIESLQGWREYREFKNAITAELEARGLNGVRQRGAEDLQQIQRTFIDAQRDKLEGWGREFDQRDSGATYDLVSQMREALEVGKVPDRPDWDGIREYVQLHDAFASELDARRVVGGSRDLQAQANADLAQMWEAAIGDLVRRNLMFADVYYQYLDGHSLSDGSH